MTDKRTRTTLRIPAELHERFDEGSRNSEIIKRLRKSFEDEWRKGSMSASELLQRISIPDTVRFNSTGNPHEDVSGICELATGLKVNSLVFASSKTRKLVAIINTEELCIVADNLNFELNSQGRASDLARLAACLDYNGLLENTFVVAKPYNTNKEMPPTQTTADIASLPCETGLPALRSLFRLMNPGIEVDI